MGECRQLPANTVESYETLPEMYLGLGVRRDSSTNASLTADRSVQTNGIDLALLRDRDAVACLDQLIRSNPSLAAYSSRTQQLIQHFRRTDPRDPDHITWTEIRRDYGQDAEDVAYSINAYLGLLHYVGQGATPPPPPPVTGMTPDLLAGYGTLTQVYLGIGIDRDTATGIARAPLPRMPQGGLDLSILNNPTAVASLEAAARGNPGLVADLHRVRQILEGLRQTDPQNPDSLTQDKIRSLYGQDAGNVLVSINAYLALLNRASGRASVVPGGGSDSGVNPWTVGGIAAGGALLVGSGVYLLRRPHITSGSAGGGRTAIDQQLREMNDGSEGEVSPPPPPPPPPPPESFVRRGVEAIRLPIPRNNSGDVRFTLGRYGSGDNFVTIPNEAVDSERNFISGKHAEIHLDVSGRYFIRDLGSTNGTSVYRDDPVRRVCENIRVTTTETPLTQGDVIRFGRSYYRFTTPAIGPVLERMAMGTESLPDNMRVAPPEFTPERPLIDRLREAQVNRRPIEIFVSGDKAKYAGRVIGLTEGDRGTVTITNGGGGTTTIVLDQIVTLRGRGDVDNLTSRYSRIPNPQFVDKSYNDMALANLRFQVMVDYADPRLSSWLEQDVGRIRGRLDRGELNQQQAAEEAWRLVREHVPYDDSRYRNGQDQAQLPDQLFRLGDFIQTGVCNERGMLVQVALQYLGIESRFVIGDVPGGRHAWVRANVRDARGRVTDLLLDPQRKSVFRVGNDSEVDSYAEESARAVHGAMMTRMGGDDIRHHARIMSFAEWNPVIDLPLDSGQLEAALRNARPELADFFRRYVGGNSGMPIRTVRDLVMRMGFTDDGTILRESFQAATSGGRPIQETLSTAIFEMIARGAQLHDIWHPADEIRRQVAGRVFRSEAIQRNLFPALPPPPTSPVAPQPAVAQPVSVNINDHARVTEANIAMEIKSRYPALRNSRNDRTVQEIAREVFREWQRTGSRIDTSPTAVVGLPAARIVDTVTGRYFEELTRRDASGAAALRRGGRDRSDLSERDRESLGREILEAIRRAPERAVESAP